MSAAADAGNSALRPAFWYDVPHGYLQLDVNPTADRLNRLARQILSLPVTVRARAEDVFRLYAIVMWELQKKRVQGCALGMHSDDRDGVTTSVLTVSSVEMPGVNPSAVLTALMSSGAGATADSGFVPVELPCAMGFLTDAIRHLSAPGTSVSEARSLEEDAVWQGTVAIPDRSSSSVIAVQLVTSSVELSDDYRGVLLGVARSVTFTDPGSVRAARQTVAPDSGSAAAAVVNDFG